MKTFACVFQNKKIRWLGWSLVNGECSWTYSCRFFYFISLTRGHSKKIFKLWARLNFRKNFFSHTVVDSWCGARECIYLSSISQSYSTPTGASSQATDGCLLLLRLPVGVIHVPVGFGELFGRNRSKVFFYICYFVSPLK